MSPRFYLKSGTGSQFIFYTINAFGFRARRSTGIKINANGWDHKKQRVNANVNDFLKINAYLSELSLKTEKAYLHFITSFTNPDKDQFLNAVFGSHDQEDIDLDQEFLKFIEKQKKRYGPNIHKMYTTAFNNFKRYAQESRTITGKDLDYLAGILMDFKKSPNYVKKQIQCLKTFAAFMGLEVITKTKIPNKRTDRTFLTIEQLNQIEKTEIQNKSLEVIKDLFLFQCWTGLRYSDLQQFTRSWVHSLDGVNCLVFFSKKTQTKSVIPLFPTAQRILKKHSGTLPRRPAGQNYNIMAKEVCKLSGLDTLIQVSKLEGSGKKVSTVPLYSVITSHTARRSFVTNMSILGLTPKEISGMTGHSQTRIVEIYDKTKAEQNAVKVFGMLAGRLSPF